MGLIGFPEMLLILVVALFFFGPDKIPEIARSLGKATGEFKKAQTETEQEIKTLGTPLSEKDTKIHNLAIEMGIDGKNKTSEQLIEEIRSKIRSNDPNQVKNTKGLT
ncbi:MAG: twin-arginine translocase TatA/TatE family subunit [Candidatus Methanoperedens sp.]|nr:twin-arginine translocase TatA/TatE family subunit [Candidatus Methanoperedens sp.]